MKQCYSSVVCKYLSKTIGLLVIVLNLHLVSAQNPNNQDSSYYKQLQNLNLNIEIPYNELIHNTINNRSQNKYAIENNISKWIEYIDLIDSSLSEALLPMELRYLPLAISEMYENNKNYHHHQGPWALSYPTAIFYGLIVNDTIDERYNMKKATPIAIANLKEIAKKHKNVWYIILAYTNGLQSINKSLTRIKKENPTIWEIYHQGQLPIKEIIPNYINCVYLSNYQDIKYQKPSIICDSIFLEHSCQLSRLLALIELNQDDFMAYNPCLISSQLPTTYPIYLPINKIEKFNQIKDSLLIIPEIQDSTINVEGQTEKKESLSNNTNLSHSQENVYYIVKSGDVLGRIATKYNTSVAKLKEYNHLKNDNIYIGQKLIVSKKSVTTTNTLNETTNNNKSIIYIVKKGDTLSAIAKKYGISVSKIMHINQLKNDKINIGQKIKIKK